MFCILKILLSKVSKTHKNTQKQTTLFNFLMFANMTNNPANHYFEKAKVGNV